MDGFISDEGCIDLSVIVASRGLSPGSLFRYQNPGLSVNELDIGLWLW